MEELQQDRHDADDSNAVVPNAAPSASRPHPTGAAAWNPALRHNSEATVPPDDEDDFFDRYRGATPKKRPEAQPIPEPVEEEEPDEPVSPIRRQSISVQHVIDVQKSDASPDELRRVPSNHVEIGGPGVLSTYEEDDEEALPKSRDGGDDGDADEEGAILSARDTVAEQRAALEESMPDADDLLQEDDNVEGGRQTTEGEMEDIGAQDGDVMSPSEHYEHQGEATAMEEAIEPSADAPLMLDEEPLPTPGYMSREPTMVMPSEGDDTMELDGTAALRHPQLKSTAAIPQLDRTFTTNFSDSPVEARQPPGRGIPSDWPSVGDDKTFGELLDNQGPSARADKATLEQVAAQESAQIAALDDDDDELLPDDEGEVKEEDLAAAWGAVIEDDELLEETPTDFDPSQVFGADDDDDGFLEDEPAPIQSAAQQRAVQTNQYHANVQQQQQQQQRQQPQYGTQSTQMFGGHGRSAGTPTTGLFDVYNTTGAMQQQPQSQQPERPAMQQAQSFVDKAKGGYQSPYDLPMDVVKPRRRPQPLQQQSSQVQQGQAVQSPAPPPRSSSMTSSSSAMGQQSQPPAGPPRTSAGSIGSLSPPQSSHSNKQGTLGAAPTQPKSVTSTPKSSSGFFEDLPMTVKQRPQRSAGAYTPQQNIGGAPGMPTPPPSMGPPSHPPSRQNTGPYMPVQQPQMQMQRDIAPQTPPVQQQAMFGGLRKPEQMPLIPNQPSQHPIQAPQVPQPPQNTRYSPLAQQHSQPGSSLPAPPALPAVASRYSPAPTSTAPTAPAATSRYSPAPGSGPAQSKPRNPSIPSNAQPPSGLNPFAPRTSSPLAVMNVDKPLPTSPPRLNGMQGPQGAISPERPAVSRYAPPTGMEQQSGMVEPPANFAHPPPMQRPRTQSPDTTMKGPRATLGMTTARPSSSAGAPPPMPHAPTQSASGPKRTALPHRRQFSRDLTFAIPTDSRSADPLQRWKGCPVFSWSPSGSIVSTFPKQTAFYSAGQGIPSVKCTPGSITVTDASVFMPMDERDTKFPGPLTARRKASKKEVLAWMGSKIEGLERQFEGATLDFSLPPEQKKRVEEKVVLWKIVRIYLEHDGALEGNPKIEEEVRRVLLPNLAQMAQVADLQSPASAAVMPDALDKQVLFQIRQALLEGQRERAVWLAEEKKLWGHAMLISSTMGPETWKQIVQSFVRSQVKTVGSDARSTAALYQVFAGNSEECVDELVPPSARAGFQMISKADGSVSGNPLEGLDQWRETLGLISGNRTASDGNSLLAMGKMLSGYGRCEAAHTCFMFARQFAKHSGADDAEANFVLLGANNSTTTPAEVIGSDLDAILLTEIYEYATSLSPLASANNTVLYIPHLQSYKLIHAQQLAAHGLKSKAQAYCDAITSAYTSTTRPSPYYHPTFTSAVAELSAFLSQTPHDGKAGFFTRPAMKTVSSGAASWFSKFVAGEEDSESNASGGGPGGARSDEAAGPFGRVSGESPDLSRSASGTDLYNPMMMGGAMPMPGVQQVVNQQFAPSSAPSRYAPGAPAAAGPRYAPTSSYGGLGMPAAEPQRPGSSRYALAPSASSLGVPRPDAVRRGSDHSSPYAPSSRRGSAQETTSSQGSYEPRPVLADHGSDYSYSPAVQSPLVQAQHAPAVHEPHAQDLGVALNGIPHATEEHDDVVDAEGGGVGYAPPTSGGYEPPSYSTYQPYEPEPDSPEDVRPKRKTFGDDDDEDEVAARAAALKKAQADREADDAFRKAAEADAARDKAQGGDQKKGWFSGWLGGKKDPNLSSPSPGPIKAKLGEENSFVYDTNLGKWVNKKAGAEAATAAAAATPPPPRGPASRVTSAPSGPPSGPPSRASSGAPPPPAGARPPTSSSGPAVPSSGPPSRVGTPASYVSSDANGPAGLNGDGPATASAIPASVAPPLRPSSSLSTASSIDDLLASGPAGSGRKGGTVKGKKKGGRYVDVMAK